MDEIAEDCIHAIATSKGIPPESIALDSSLESLQVDSLDRVSMSFDLEEKYGVELAEHRLHAIATVGDLVREIHEAVALKSATAGNPAR